MSQVSKIHNHAPTASPFFSLLMEKNERVCEILRFSDGEFLFQKGERDDRVFLIQKGQVDVGYDLAQRRWVDQGAFGMIDMDEENNLNPVWSNHVILKEGECLGETSCIRCAGHGMSARAIGDVRVLAVPGHRLKALCSNNSDLSNCLTELLAKTERELALK